MTKIWFEDKRRIYAVSACCLFSFLVVLPVLRVLGSPSASLGYPYLPLTRSPPTACRWRPLPLINILRLQGSSPRIMWPNTPPPHPHPPKASLKWRITCWMLRGSSPLHKVVTIQERMTRTIAALRREIMRRYFRWIGMLLHTEIAI